jgi:hypothetical protein
MKVTNRPLKINSDIARVRVMRIHKLKTLKSISLLQLLPCKSDVPGYLLDDMMHYSIFSAAYQRGPLAGAPLSIVQRRKNNISLNRHLSLPF